MRHPSWNSDPCDYANGPGALTEDVFLEFGDASNALDVERLPRPQHGMFCNGFHECQSVV